VWFVGFTGTDVIRISNQTGQPHGKFPCPTCRLLVGDVDFYAFLFSDSNSRQAATSVALFCSSFLIPPFAAVQPEILKMRLVKRRINQEDSWGFGAVPNLSTRVWELSASRPTCFASEEGIVLGIQTYFAVEVFQYHSLYSHSSHACYVPGPSEPPAVFRPISNDEEQQAL